MYEITCQLADTLRAIKAGELDGSEPAVAGLLNDFDAQPKWTVFVVEKDRDHGTTFVTSLPHEDIEQAKQAALEEAAESWGEDVASLRVLGVAAGGVSLLEWDDNN